MRQLPSLSAVLRRFDLAALVVLGLIAISYGPVLRYPFTDIDTWPLLLTSRFQSLSDALVLFQQELLSGRMINAKYYRPLVQISYGIDLAIWGVRPFGFHLTDLLLHAANCLGTYWLTLLLLGSKRRGTALACAALFAIHPLHVENIPAIARRAELLVAFFSWLSLALLLLSFPSPERPKRTQTISITLSLLCFLGALLSKESSFVLLPLFAVALFFLHPDLSGLSIASRLHRSLRLITLYLLPFFLLFLIYFLWRWHLLGGIGGYSDKQPLWARILFNLIGHPLGLLAGGTSAAWSHLAAAFLSATVRMQVAAVLMLLCGTLWVVYGLLRTAWQFRNRAPREFPPGVLGFLVLFACSQVGLLILGGFNFRYLYLEVMPFSILLVMITKEAIHVLRENNWIRGDCAHPRCALFTVGAVLLFTWGNLFLGSPLFIQTPLQTWRRDAELADRVNREVLRQRSANPAIETFYLVNFPYQAVENRYARILTLPLSVISLEPSLQAYLDWHTPDSPARVVGLSYLYLDADTIQSKNGKSLLIDTAFSPERTIDVHVQAGGYPTQCPWDQSFGLNRNEARALVSRPDPLRKDLLRIDLTKLPDTMEKSAFLIFEGEESILLVQNPFAPATTAALQRP